jgi:hypothetical protein
MSASLMNLPTPGASSKPKAGTSAAGGNKRPTTDDEESDEKTDRLRDDVLERVMRSMTKSLADLRNDMRKDLVMLVEQHAVGGVGAKGPVGAGALGQLGQALGVGTSSAGTSSASSSSSAGASSSAATASLLTGGPSSAPASTPHSQTAGVDNKADPHGGRVDRKGGLDAAARQQVVPHSAGDPFDDDLGKDSIEDDEDVVEAVEKLVVATKGRSIAMPRTLTGATSAVSTRRWCWLMWWMHYARIISNWCGASQYCALRP